MYSHISSISTGISEPQRLVFILSYGTYYESYSNVSFSEISFLNCKWETVKSNCKKILAYISIILKILTIYMNIFDCDVMLYVDDVWPSMTLVNRCYNFPFSRANIWKSIYSNMFFLIALIQTYNNTDIYIQ